MKRNDLRTRMHISWIAFFVHRWSGVLLAIFLPLHFWTLAQAIDGEARLQTVLNWYDSPLFTVGEWGLVFLLVVHAVGGFRLLLMEFRPWRGLRRGWVVGSWASALGMSFVFLYVAIG